MKIKNQIIKTMLVSGLLVGSIGTACAGIYVGIDYGQVDNEHEFDFKSKSGTADNEYDDFSIKLGSGEDGDWKSQIRLSMITYDRSVFDAVNKDLTEFGADFIKEFKLAQDFHPFVKVGFGYGWMDLEPGLSESSIKAFSLSGGVGVSYKVIESLDIVGGVDYTYRQWQDITDGVDTLSTTDSGMKGYVGVNYYF